MSNINLNINGIIYPFSSKLTLSNLSKILGENEDSDINNDKGRVAAAILNSIRCEDNVVKPDIEQIISSDDSLFKTYIDAVIRDNNCLSSYFLKYSDEELCVRFCKTCENYYNTLMHEIAENIKKAFQENASSLAELSKTLSSCVNGIGKVMSEFATAISPVTNYINSIQDTISQSLKQFSEHLKQIDWETWKQNYEQWGKYGWAIIDHAPINLYSETPQSQKDADKEGLKYFNKSALIDFWLNIKKHNFKKQEIADIDEAISCFNSKNYKSCSMVVCAIIDGICIKNQSRSGNLHVGIKAIRKFEEKFQLVNSEFTTGFIFLFQVNMIQCLLILFENANNFKDEPERYNRNFVSHGMSNRKVRRKDCIKLFLILNNLMEMNKWCQDGND